MLANVGERVVTIQMNPHIEYKATDLRALRWTDDPNGHSSLSGWIPSQMLMRGSILKGTAYLERRLRGDCGLAGVMG